MILPPAVVPSNRWAATPPWSRAFRLGKAPLTLAIRKAVGTSADPDPYPPTLVEVRRGATRLAGATTDLFFDPSEMPYLRVTGGAAVLAFAADPGAGSGPFASLWWIGSGGRRLRHLGDLRRADLRDLPRGGVIREFREAKYATPDVLSRFPDLPERRSYVVRYRLDAKAGCLRLLDVRLVPETEPWPWTVRFPHRRGRNARKDPSVSPVFSVVKMG